MHTPFEIIQIMQAMLQLQSLYHQSAAYPFLTINHHGNVLTYFIQTMQDLAHGQMVTTNIKAVSLPCFANINKLKRFTLLLPLQ